MSNISVIFMTRKKYCRWLIVTGKTKDIGCSVDIFSLQRVIRAMITFIKLINNAACCIFTCKDWGSLQWRESSTITTRTKSRRTVYLIRPANPAETPYERACSHVIFQYTIIIKYSLTEKCIYGNLIKTIYVEMKWSIFILLN